MSGFSDAQVEAAWQAFNREHPASALAVVEVGEQQ